MTSGRARDAEEPGDDEVDERREEPIDPLPPLNMDAFILMWFVIGVIAVIVVAVLPFTGSRHAPCEAVILGGHPTAAVTPLAKGGDVCAEGRHVRRLIDVGAGALVFVCFATLAVRRFLQKRAESHSSEAAS